MGFFKGFSKDFPRFSEDFPKILQGFTDVVHISTKCWDPMGAMFHGSHFKKETIL